MSTPPSHTHLPPSLPTSPLAKRPKVDGVQAPPMAATGESQKPAPLLSSSDGPPPLLVKRLSEKAKTPTRGSAFAAGYDLYAAKECVIPKRGKALVDTDLAIAVGVGCYGRIAPRSGLAVKHFIDTGAGVIDADYRGQVKVLLFNHSENDFEVREGERIAQLVLERIWTPEVVVVEELEESVRGVGGFGSTGTG
ncbi:hypothetical protein JMJ35_001571 [Cladonia borealis]|uniref:Deoxyuridine 5'-triphosphate nucleotidohydrolase n=1 Tax=Cladonia borealis TaxID=184061 RepID=A0AA39R601_9LECA|nr:hypothetical protein JMJ35_001571 [Cladonia borealis]